MKHSSSADDTAVLPVVPPPDDLAGPDGSTGPADPDDPAGSSTGGGLAAELAEAAPRRWHNRATLPLAALALVAGGFLGGALVTKQSSPAAAPGASRGNFGGGAFPGGTGQGGYQGGTGQGGLRGGNAQPSGAPAAAAAGATTGKVKLVDGTTVYVETADGTVITVKTNGKTAVKAAKDAKLTDLKPGASVSVTGSSAGEDTITATAVTAQ